MEEKGNVAEIEERMRKTDFETFPKVSEGDLVSIIKRYQLSSLKTKS